jgi:hypothetical protein
MSSAHPVGWSRAQRETVGRVMTRRLSAVAVAGALAVAGLAGCRSDPGVAAYVGSTQITETQVDKIAEETETLVAQHNEARNALSEEKRATLPDDDRLSYDAVAPTRERIVSTLIFGEVCRQMRQEGGKSAPPAEETAAKQVAHAESLPEDAPFVQDRVEYYSCLSSLSGEAPPVTPTAEQLRELYDRGVAAKVFEAAQPFEQVAAQLAANEQVRGAFGARQVLVAAVEGHDVTVNPRYRPLELPILIFSQNDTAVSVPLSPVDADPAVADAR